jgi:FG-GAP repeat
MRRFRSTVLAAGVAVAMAGVIPPAGASSPHAWVQQIELTGTDRGTDDGFGPVAISGSTAVVGSIYHGGTHQQTGPGAAYVFGKTDSGWVQTAELKASDGTNDDRFGASVAISGSTIVIGAEDENFGQGAAYVFTHATVGWRQTAKIENPNAAENADQFGTAVGVSGGNLIVGAPHAEFLGDGDGAAYVFTGRKKNWALQKTFLDPGSSNDFFGGAVAISGSTALIGATGQSSGSGAVYVVGDTGTGWVAQKTLTAVDAEVAAFFGAAVAIDGTTAVIGAEYGAAENGSAYVFSNPGTGWVQDVELTDPRGSQLDDYGAAVAISGPTVAVGSSLRKHRRGAVFVYTHTASGWGADATLTASDGRRAEGFGQSVAVAGSDLLAESPGHKVGNVRGVVYAFSRS